MKIVRTITINRAPQEVFASWRELETLPRYMNHLVSVKALNGKVSHWITKAPAGRQVSWEAEIAEEHASQFLAWHSRRGADVPNAGTVHFQPAPVGRGTEVTVSLDCVVPAGILGRTIARLFGEEPSQQVEDDLRRFKSVLETGEAPSSGDGRPG
jgi:uncharacterized membrane protein